MPKSLAGMHIADVQLDQRHTRTLDGVLVIKSQQHRTQEMNRSAALARLQDVVDGVATPPKPRRATKPSYGSKQRRLEGKSQRSEIKTLRGKVSD